MTSDGVGKQYYQLSSDQALEQLGTKREGLSNDEVVRRQRQYGMNELEKHKPPSKIKMFLAQFNSFIVWILIAATIIRLRFFLRHIFFQAKDSSIFMSYLSSILNSDISNFRLTCQSPGA